MYRILNNFKPTKRAGRVSKNPLEQGQLKELARLFIWPFLKYRPKEQDIQVYIENLFRVETCKVELWRVVEPFIMPGEIGDLLENIHKGHTGLIAVNRQSYKGQSLWIRVDSEMPDRIDIEMIYKNNQSHVFVLNQAQYSNIIKMIRIAPYPCHKSLEKQ